MTTPEGQSFRGVRITIDDGLPPPKLDYAHERVAEVLSKLPIDYKMTVHSGTNITIETV